MRNLPNLLTTSAIPTSLGASSLVPTPAERLLGRFMRAPDHPGGDGGDGGAGGDAAAPGGDNGADGEGDAGKGNEGADGAKEGEQVTTSVDGGDTGDKGPDAGDDATSIAGGAGKAKEGEDGGDGGAAEVLGAPEAYDVKLPAAAAEAGMAFDKEVFDLVEPTLREMNLSNSAAQKLADTYAEKVVPALVDRGKSQAEQAQLERGAAIRKEWADAARADPEIGGAKFDQTVDACARVWDKFGIKAGEGIRLLLDESGIGNHPDMLRFLSRVATVTGEGRFVPSDAAGSDARPIWDRVYGQPEPAAAR